MLGGAEKSILTAWAIALLLDLAQAKVGFAQVGFCPFWGSGFGMMGGTWGWNGGIFMLLFWIVIIAAGIFFVRWLISVGKGDGTISLPNRNSPLDILKRRYAMGEINKEQYESMRQDVQ